MSGWFDPTLFGAVFVTLFVIMHPLGGIPLFLGLTGGRTNRLTDRQDDPSEVPDVNVALVPLGTPLLAGPGAIVATIVFVQQADGLADVPRSLPGSWRSTWPSTCPCASASATPG